MKRIIIENLKPGDQLLAYDSIGLRWVKCRVNLVGNYTAVIEYIEGSLKGILWHETIERLKDPDFYKSSG